MLSCEQPMTLYQFLSLIVSAAGFMLILLGLGLSIKQLNDLKVTREGEIVKTMYEWWNLKEMYKAHTYTQRMKFKNWKDFKKRNPQGSEGWRKWMLTMNFFNTIGILIEKRALDKETARMMLKGLPRLWKKVEPLVAGYRSDYGSSHFAEEFERISKDLANS